VSKPRPSLSPPDFFAEVHDAASADPSSPRCQFNCRRTYTIELICVFVDLRSISSHLPYFLFLAVGAFHITSGEGFLCAGQIAASSPLRIPCQDPFSRPGVARSIPSISRPTRPPPLRPLTLHLPSDPYDNLLRAFTPLDSFAPLLLPPPVTLEYHLTRRTSISKKPYVT